ncbi:MAG TPA: metallophosphoesterase [Mucilaginibacter sp.]|jgi:predicted phosphodiesterase
MKHIIIGDLHGKDCWKEINISAYDKVVFLGDYVDHWNLPDLKISQNLEEIIKLKSKHPKKIELLLGNHDVQYLHYPHFRCSGFRPSMQRSLTWLFDSNKDLFKIAYQKGDHLFTHAGVTNAWYAEFLELPVLQQIRDEHDTIADLLNKTEQTAGRSLLHRVGSIRGGYGYGGPTWADRKEMIADMLDGYHQVVGHTVIPRVEVVRFSGKSVTFIDVLDTVTYFHEMDC